MKTDQIIGTLIGLANACNNNPKTPDTDQILIHSLAFSSLYPDAKEEEIKKQVAVIVNEKKRIVPDCFVCMNPCGNTSDYDINRVYQAEENIRKIKLQILENLKNIALFLVKTDSIESQIDLIYHALSYISYDLEIESYQEMLDKTTHLKEQITWKGSE